MTVNDIYFFFNLIIGKIVKVCISDKYEHTEYVLYFSMKATYLNSTLKTRARNCLFKITFLAYPGLLQLIHAA